MEKIIMSTLYGEFPKESVFAAVDESNKRFDTYTKEERKEFYKRALAQFKADAEHQSGWKNPYQDAKVIR